MNFDETRSLHLLRSINEEEEDREKEFERRQIKSCRFEMRIDPDKLKEYKKAAKEEGVSTSAWIERAAEKRLLEKL